MFCSNCGKDIGNAKFCPYCGAEAPSSSAGSVATGTLVVRKADLNTLVGVGAEVYVDSQFNTSLDGINNATLLLPAGKHEVKFVFKDYEDASVIIDVIPNVTSTYVLAVDENSKMTELTLWEDPNAAPKMTTKPTPFSSQSERKSGGMTCPRCGGTSVSIQVMQENHGSTTVTKSKGNVKEKGHGLLWWLFIGWWWKIVDLFIWVFAFFPRLIVHFLFPKKKKYKTDSASVTHTTNKIVYKKICTCQSCGNSWSI